ncbi:MAG: ATP-binding cassette domain-containing protein [Clostridia bacterium]|nr:ATP-binding cassette domain-containing protein [Clostridia bacterium]
MENIKVHFPQAQGFQRAFLRAVDGVSLDIFAGETVGLVGESGCGKSTLGRAVTGLLPTTDGKILYHGKDVNSLKKADKIRFRKNVQMVFQDPAASLNPRLKVRQIVMEPLLKNVDMTKAEKETLVAQMVATVGRPADALDRYPHEFSGGQQQRIGIARSLVLKPEFIVCDEAVSALDVSVQAQILNLLDELREKYTLTYLFISHNLSVVKHMCDRIAVMYLGRIVELGTAEQIFGNPLHPYTRALISAIPVAGKKRQDDRIVLTGDLPAPTEVIAGCAFHNRCYECGERCDKECPALREVEPGHFVSCLYV